jgi:hypothetical protein
MVHHGLDLEFPWKKRTKEAMLLGFVPYFYMFLMFEALLF